jgi:hypothetical protein
MSHTERRYSNITVVQRGYPTLRVRSCLMHVNKKFEQKALLIV